MFYYYFRIFNWFCTIFGMKKPFLLQNGQPCKITYWHKLWSVAIISAFIAADYISIVVTNEIRIKKLQNISDANDLVFNIIIIIIDFFHGSVVWSELYQTFDSIFSRLMLCNKDLKMFSLKLYWWFSLPTAIFVTSIFVEFLYSQYPQFTLLIKFPSYLATLHLAVHLNLIVALLRLLNNKLTNMKPFYSKHLEAPLYAQQIGTYRYLFDLNINFMMIGHDQLKSDFSPNLLCKVYDDLSTCVKLLETLHGKQILCTIWIMFSNAVIGATLISSEETKYPWMLMTKAALPFFWFSLCCFVEDQLRKEVEWTEILIMKHLIDFKCDSSRKKILETFKQLVSTNSLDFTAGNLFHVNYSTILGIIMNVITYSIILVQLFLNTN